MAVFSPTEPWTPSRDPFKATPPSPPKGGANHDQVNETEDRRGAGVWEPIAMNTDDRGPNNCEFLKHVLDRLQQHGFASLIFGGWAEELLQLVPPRPHRDVDLLLPADSFVAFDRFLASAESYGWHEIAAKRFAHKRAFLAQGVMVEFTLVWSGLITNFWGDVAFHWLDPLAHSRPIEIDGFTASLVSAANLLRYRQLHRTTEPWRWREQPTASAESAT